MMKQFFANGMNLFNRRQSNILSAAAVIMLMVLTSRTLGLLRDRMLTARFAVDELGVYFAAFRLPNMIFELLVMGAISTAFIPVFSALLSSAGKKQAFALAASVINSAVILFAILAVPIFLFSPSLSRILAPGFNQKQIELMTSFTRIMLLAQVLPLLVGNFLSAMLQSFKRFLLPALAPVVYNLGIIFGVLFLSPSHGLYGPVWGVVIGACLFMIIQIPSLFKLQFRFEPRLDYQDKNVIEVGRLMLPRTLGLAVSQIDTTVDLILSSLLGAGAVSVFNFAQHLQQLPIGLFGLTISQAALPTLAEVAILKKREEFKLILITSLQQILFFILPVSALLIILRIPLVRLVFGADRFDWAATVMTGKTLAFFSLSLFAQSTVPLLARAFYALHDSKTPVIIGIVAVLANVFLSLAAIRLIGLPVWGLALSASLSSIINAVLLLVFLNRQIGRFSFAELFLPLLKMLLASVITGLALYIPMKLLDRLVFDTTRTINLLALTGVASFSGLITYLFLAWFLEIKQAYLILKLLPRLRRLPQIILDVPEVMEEGKPTVP